MTVEANGAGRGVVYAGRAGHSPTCKGARCSAETLEVLYRDKSIADILEMSIEESVVFFADQATISRKIAVLGELGLGYLKLGHPSTILSGGEAQRVKLAAELGKLKRLLTTLFHESTNGGDIRIRQLFLIGSTEVALELLSELRASHPQPAQPELTQLLAELSSSGLAPLPTVDEINRMIMPEKPTEDLPHKAFIDPKQQVRLALQMAGLRTDVDMLMDLSQQLAVFSKMARGEFDVDLVHIDNETKTVFFRYKDCVFHYAVRYPEEYQYPLVESAIANAVLKHSGVANRFVAYGNFDGNSEIYFYFGPHQLARTLEDGFDIGFLPGWQQAFDLP